MREKTNIPILLAILFLDFFILLRTTAVPAVEISDVPLEAAIATAPPIVMYIFDNSGSMDLEFMTDEYQGLFEGAYYLFPDGSYKPEPDHEYGPGHCLSSSERLKWRSQWSGYNHMYYSPKYRYSPWPTTEKNRFGNADLNRPASDPMQKDKVGRHIEMADLFFSFRIGSQQIRVTNAHYFTHHDANKNQRWDGGETIYLVTWTDLNGDGDLDLSGMVADDCRRYFRLADDGDGLVEDNELIPVSDELEKNLIRPFKKDQTGRFQGYFTDKEELQNFVNWITYYRRREFVAKAAIARMIANSAGMKVGLYAVNSGPRIAAKLINDFLSDTDNSVAKGGAGELIDALYLLNSKGSTPLRIALDQVGRYLHQDYPSTLGESPFSPDGGGCQRACAIVASDGFWNDTFTGVGNADGDNGKPYADAWDNTLADVAMTYYEADLAPNLPDVVPPTRCDPAVHQHMNTYTMSFGYGDSIAGNKAGSADKGSTPCLRDDFSGTFHWRQPSSLKGVEEQGGDPESADQKIDIHAAAVMDDLRHAALNGRGRFMFACYSDPLNRVLPEILAEMMETACAADIVVDGMALTGDSKVFKASLHSEDWSGEVSAYQLDINRAQNGTFLGPLLWHASNMLPGGDSELWDQRRIVTYGGKWIQPQGIAFRFRQMSDDQLAVLGSDSAPGTADSNDRKNLVDFIRGKSFPEFRSRDTLLGDIVHSTPALFGRTLFVGANDGMLHAFDTESGAERFAYIPNLVFGHLHDLTNIFQVQQHRCNVDGPLYVGEVMAGEYRRKAYLVGGLGKGGKGYFCLQVAQRERSRVDGNFDDYHWVFHVDNLDSGSSEAQVMDLVRWEYPRPDTSNDSMDNDGDGFMDEAGEVDPNMGYSFSQAYAVNANCPEGGFRPVVIFGNGYNSENKRALLYVLSADSGEIVRIIDTGAADDNGLSTPALIDVDLDRRVDFVYAGDLKGNLWKFDLTADDPGRWGVAYGKDLDGDGTIDAANGDSPAPLFQAHGQPITGRPDVMVMHGSCTPQAPGFMVIFGTGRYLGVSDRKDTAQQSLYAIWDYGGDGHDGEYLGRLIDRDSGRLSSGPTLLRKQIENEIIMNGTQYRRLSTDNMVYTLTGDEEDGNSDVGRNSTGLQGKTPKSYAGWFFDFPLPEDSSTASAERSVGDVTIRDGKIIVSTFVPDSSPCSSGGRSWLYLLDACSGNAPMDLNNNPVLIRSFQGKISDRPAVVKDLSRPRLDLVLFGDDSGRILTLDMVGEHWGKVYWRQGWQFE